MSDSYTSGGQSIRDHLRQITTLRGRYTQNCELLVAQTLREIGQAEARIYDQYRVRVADLDVLELGPGQLLGQIPYLSRRNRVSAADRDVIAWGFHPAQYARMLGRNGIVRAFKTVGRKVMGVDRRYHKHLCRTLGIRSLPGFTIRQENADSLSFPDDSFDLVYSRAVFQHLPAPVDAIREIKRILRPGGVAYISLHPFTSPTGCLDPRVLYGRIENELGLWPHLRPEWKDKVKPNAYVNGLGLRDWRRIFTEQSPCPVFFLSPVDEEYFPLAAALKDTGHLQNYSIEELTTMHSGCA
jgi:SAM-dependent methyltransferase